MYLSSVTAAPSTMHCLISKYWILKFPHLDMHQIGICWKINTHTHRKWLNVAYAYLVIVDSKAFCYKNSPICWVWARVSSCMSMIDLPWNVFFKWSPCCWHHYNSNIYDYDFLMLNSKANGHLFIHLQWNTQNRYDWSFKFTSQNGHISIIQFE